MEYNRVFSIIDRLRLQVPLDGITMELLAGKSGVSRATLYRLFGSRREIFNQYFIHSGVSGGSEPLPDVSERIFKAAGTIFMSNGFAATTIERIAAEAGVGSATLYRHFKSKEYLVEQVLARLLPQEDPDLTLLEEAVDPQAALQQFTLSMLDWMSRNQGVLKLLLFESEALIAIQKKMAKMRTRTQDGVMTFFRDQLPNSPFRETQAQTLTITYLGLVMGFSFSNTLVDSYELHLNETAVWITSIIQQKIEGFGLK